MQADQASQASQASLKVVLGSGPLPIHPCHYRYIDNSWLLTDAIGEPGVQAIDARHLPWGPDSIDAIYASHLLEHFPRHEIDAVLQEWARVLKPQAPCTILVPDARWAWEILARGDANSEALALDVFYNRDLDGQRDCHRMCFTLETLKRHFEAFFHCQEFGIDHGDAHHVQTIFVKGVKR